MSICRICGKEKSGQPFNSWVKDTFTNYDQLVPGDVICDDCLFWFGQRSVELQERMGKDKPQKMQNYSHFVKNGEWTPLSKGDKAKMVDMLLTPPFPELAAIADSGQKHIAFRAPRNPAGQKVGWVQFEEQRVFVNPPALLDLLTTIEELYTEFAKAEISTGRYSAHRVVKFGLDRWGELENKIKPMRGQLLFELAIYLAQRKEPYGTKRNDSNTIEANLAGSTCGLQEQVPDDDMGSVRERDQERGIHERPGEVCQPSLFPS